MSLFTYILSCDSRNQLQHRDTNWKTQIFFHYVAQEFSFGSVLIITSVLHECRRTTDRRTDSWQSWLYSGPQVVHVIFASFSIERTVMSNPAPGNQANSSIVKGDLLGNNSKPYVPVAHPSWLTPKHWHSLHLSFSLTHTHNFKCKAPKRSDCICLCVCVPSRPWN